MIDDLITRKLVITFFVVAFMFVPLSIIVPSKAEDTSNYVYAEKMCSCIYSQDTHTLLGFTYPMQEGAYVTDMQVGNNGQRYYPTLENGWSETPTGYARGPIKC